MSGSCLDCNCFLGQAEQRNNVVGSVGRSKLLIGKRGRTKSREDHAHTCYVMASSLTKDLTMRTCNRCIVVSLAFFGLACSQLSAQSDRGIVVNRSDACPGYTLFAPLGNTNTYLVDIDGNVVHSWASDYMPANSVFLLDNGDLLRCSKAEGNQRFGSRGPSGGRLERYSWDGELLWNFVYSDDQQHHHHDIVPLPNGNVLLIAWHYISKADAIAAGRRPESISDAGIFPDKIVEIEQTGKTSGKTVWEWNSWDHLIQDFDPSKENYGDVAKHPELIDVNLNPRPRTDWMHSNCVTYNSQLDQIILNVRSFGEFFVIDHSTTTEEAASHTGGKCGKGGDILYRWGNPANYRAGTSQDRKLFGQHDARWVDAGFPGAGNITVFNNGSQRPGGEYSSIEEIVPPFNQKKNKYELVSGSAFGPERPAWQYTANNKLEFYSSFISGAERLPNGNTLICAGAHGEFIEVTKSGEIAWKYLNPFYNEGSPEASGRNPAPRGNAGRNRGGSPQSPHIVFRAERYSPDYPAFQGRDLQPKTSASKN